MQCKYCSKLITNKKTKCTEVECITSSKYECQKILKCLHSCLFVNTSKKCFCLLSSCQFNQNKENFNVSNCCCICYESFYKFPLCILDCNHLFHFKCFGSYLQSYKSLFDKGSLLKFGFLKCPICNIGVYSCKNHPDLNSLIFYYREFECKAKIHYDKLIQEDIIDSQEIFERCLFYICYSCEDVFYGGTYECNTQFNIDEDYIENTKLCIYCLNDNVIDGIIDCEKHGREFLIYKCRFCCNQSSHFCFGDTHFCEECHLKQLSGINLKKLKPSEYEICNEEICFLNGKHPRNGKEYVIGCGLCK